MGHSNINNIIATINGEYGISDPHQYTLEFSAPLAIPDLDVRHLQLVCHIAELPGRQVITEPQRIYSTIRKMPKGMVYNDLNVSFICTGNMLERKSIDAWHSAIMDPTNNYMNYYDDYISTITIKKRSKDGYVVYQVMCEEAYPVSVETQPLTWVASGEFLEMKVQFG